MRIRRPTAVLVLGLSAAAVLAGCRTSPSVAAYVGEEQITVAELETEVDERLTSSPVLAEAVGERTGEYTRQVLGLLVNEQVYAAAAERYGVRVDDAAVRSRLTDLLAGTDPEEAFESLAATRGLSRDDVLATVRQQLVLEQIAVAAGEADEVDEASLRQGYEASLAGPGPRPFGVITVPDQATADMVLAALLADPTAYPDLAAQYPGQTLPAVQSLDPAQLPPALGAAVLAAAPGTAFAQPAPELGGVAVIYVPTFEEVRFQLAQEALGRAQQAGSPLVRAVAVDLDVTVNPRFGTYDEGTVVPADGGVVDILEDAAAAGSGN